ncbi:MAG TPA: L-aspartate oxidase [Cycloclasticus sp.]|jgi:L-aspartate oxidase|nr:L-aspartate oxidase [Cycloclasticus sp.]HIL91544.1 L-aspartate oxidase [Cycloclasticus sp.]
MPNNSFTYDVIIIGSGAAGLGLALSLPSHLQIAILSKLSMSEGSTYYAQGGISAVLDEIDSLSSHQADTVKSGAGLCHEEIVELVVSKGKASIDWLMENNVQFSTDNKFTSKNKLHLTKEGGHSHRRVVHADDSTGRAVQTALSDQVVARSNIEIFEHHNVIDLVTTEQKNTDESRISGCYVLDAKKDVVISMKAPCVTLATGGASKVYLYTSNPDVSTGDGIAMAWRAGCRVANMEFMQFHPTCLFHPQAKSFLISEAVRGESGLLLLPDGSRFMPNFDKRAELAPRDIVARAIDHEMKRLGIPSVYLDISHRTAKFTKSHFPMLYERCLEFGFDMTKDPLPVVPAAHYTCGGVMTDKNGLTDITGLYAIGETAFTGLHGANRMASNSILECLVFAKQSSEHICSFLKSATTASSIEPWDDSQVINSDEAIVVSHNWAELRQFMWDYVGIVRTTKRLERAKHRITLLNQEINEYYGKFHVTSDFLELRNLVNAAELIIDSALLRKESRGLHYTLDYPELDDINFKKDTVLKP